MYTTKIGLSAIIVKVALTDELFLKVRPATLLHVKEETRLLYYHLSLCTTEFSGHKKRAERDNVVRAFFDDIFRVCRVRGKRKSHYIKLNCVRSQFQ